MARIRSKRKITISAADLLSKISGTEPHEAMKNFLENTLPAFSNDLEKALKNNMKRLSIGVTGDLEKYLYSRTVTFANGDAKTGIKFNFYGIHVDKGAGKGMLASEQETGRGITTSRAARGLSNRQPKPWLSEVLTEFEVKLEELIASEGAKFIEEYMQRELIKKLTIITQ